MQSPRAHRTTELIKEFSRQGHRVTVYAVLGQYDYTSFQKKYGIIVKNIPLKWQVNPYNSDGTRKRTFIDKVLGKLLGRILEFPDIEFTYRIPQIIKENKTVDLLISIANPHSIHWGCRMAKTKTPLSFPPKWIADCGDPYMKGKHKSKHPFWFSFFEKKFCQSVDHISVPIASAKNFYYKGFRDKIVVIPQGFKFEIPQRSNNKKINTVPTFSYSGTFIKDIRNPEPLLDFLSQLKSEFKFIIYTAHTDLIDKYREKMGQKLVIRNLVPRDILLNELKKVDFLINIENINSPGQVPSKLIDYAIANRPIISVNPANVDVQNLKDFINGDYSNSLTIENLKQYQIENICEQFTSL